MKLLTKKQAAVLEFINKFYARHGYVPTVRDIQFEFKFASSNAAASHLEGLERKGAITRIGPPAARNYLPTEQRSSIACPHCAGEIEVVEKIKHG